MSLFKQFPKIDYDLELTNELQTLIDISRLVDANDILSADSVAYTKYNIIDGARPDIISQLLYNTPEYYWTFFIANDHLKDGYRAWPKSEVGFEKYIEENYDSVVMTSPPFTTRIIQKSAYTLKNMMKKLIQLNLNELMIQIFKK